MTKDQNLNPIERARAISSAEETFTLVETGGYVTDVLRAKTGADISLFLDNRKNGKFNARGISSKFYKVEIRYGMQNPG